MALFRISFDLLLLAVFRLQVGVHTFSKRMSQPCHLHQGTLMNLKFNLHWKEGFLLLLVFLELSSFHIHQEPSTWLTVLVA